MIRFVYPNTSGERGSFYGCGRYEVFASGKEAGEGYRLADPDSVNISEIMTAISLLAPESSDSKSRIYEIKDDNSVVYLGDSLDLAYLLAYIRSRNPQWSGPPEYYDIWCTGCIDIVDGRPFLKAVASSKGFDVKLEAFMRESNPDELFILPAANYLQRHEDLCEQHSIRVLSLDQAHTLERLFTEPIGQKTIIKVHGHELPSLVGLAFSPPRRRITSLNQRPSTASMKGIFLGMLACVLVGIAFYLFLAQPRKESTRLSANPVKSKEVKDSQKTNRLPPKPAVDLGGPNDVPKNANLHKVNSPVQEVLTLIRSARSKEPSPSAKVLILVGSSSNGPKNWRVFKDGDIFSPNDVYKIVFQADSEAYFYVFQVIGKNEVKWLFPKNESFPLSCGTNPAPAGSWVEVPAENESFKIGRLDKESRLYVVGRKNPWKSLEEALQKASETNQIRYPLYNGFDLAIKAGWNPRLENVKLSPNMEQLLSEMRHFTRGRNGILTVEKRFKCQRPEYDSIIGGSGK